MRGLDEQPARVRLPGTADVTVTCSTLAGLADARVEPEIADELPRDAKRETSPITATIASAVIGPTPGIVISRRTSACSSAICPSDSSASAISPVSASCRRNAEAT